MLLQGGLCFRIIFMKHDVDFGHLEVLHFYIENLLTFPLFSNFVDIL